jgi:dihydroorotase
VQRIFGLQSKGRIAVGYDADFTVVDSGPVHDHRRLASEPLRLVALYRHGEGPRPGTIIRGHQVWEAQLADSAVGEPLKFAGAL